MEHFTLLSDWEILLLASPLLIGIALFGIVLWSDARYERKVKEKLGNTKAD